LVIDGQSGGHGVTLTDLSSKPGEPQFLLRLLRRQGEQWLLEPQRPGDGVIALDLESFDRSGLFGVVAHAVHHLARSPSRRR
jgi:hypothetical protein